MLAAVLVAHGASAQESRVAELRAASRSRPGDGAASLAYGRALRRAGHLADAITELHRGFAVAGGSKDMATQLHWEAARAYADKHDLPRATASCHELEKKKGAGPESTPTPESHACTAMAYLSWQRASEALTEAAACLADDPSNFEAKLAEGRAYELELKPADAEASLRAAVAMRSGADGEEAHAALGRVLWREGKRDEGIAELRRALNFDPFDPDALFELGSALTTPDRRGYLEAATRERPSFVEAWLALGTLLVEANDLAGAKAAADTVNKIEAGNVPALVLAGKVAMAQGHADEALKDGQAALKIVPNNAAAMLLVADADGQKGDLDAAIEAYQTAWGLDHGNPLPLLHASALCHASGRDTSARAFASKLAQEFPAFAPGWDALGDALAGQKETAAARDAYGKALSAPDGAVDRAAVSRKLAALR
ncbi:MAG TPA: tetratricopeptide repeat protein [Polyangiaceae bacterium]|jgi:tetratricopeptide (TPR) repeat protein|nr:tetratricopeptide repeat protein [Polyangiaceae bacterium]